MTRYLLNVTISVCKYSFFILFIKNLIGYQPENTVFLTSSTAIDIIQSICCPVVRHAPYPIAGKMKNSIRKLVSRQEPDAVKTFIVNLSDHTIGGEKYCHVIA